MRALIATLCLIATPALADVTGPARVFGGDTIEVHDQRIRLHGIDARMSHVGGKANLVLTWSELCFLATS